MSGWLMVDDIAAAMHFHPRTVQRLCRERRIPHVRIGRNIRFTPDQLKQIEVLYSLEAETRVEVDIPNPTFRPDRAVVVDVDFSKQRPA